MNFNQLKYIIAVDRFRNFARAAQDCDIAQSTLSKEIQRLEKEYGVMIFDRSRHPVVPTMKGVDLLIQAHKMLDEYERFDRIARQTNNEPSGEFNLGILPSLAPYLLPLFVNRLSARYPELIMHITELGTREMEEQLQGGTIDGGISISPFFKQGFYESPLFEERFVIYLNEDHLLAMRKSIHWDDLPLDELLLHDDIKQFLLQHPASVSKPAMMHHIRNVTYQSGSLETIRKIIDLHGGITLLPETACLYMGERRRRMVRKIEGSLFSRTISLIKPRGFEKTRIVKALRKEILASLPNPISGVFPSLLS